MSEINNKDLFTVGELANLFDINKKTLRYYDEIELFKPSYVDEKNSYRYYTINQFGQLNTIIYLKDIGMPLNTIKSHLENINIENTLELFKAQEKVIKEKIEKLNIIQSKIRNRIIKIEDSMNYEELNEIRELDFDERVVVYLSEKIKSNKDLELCIRRLENKANRKSSIFLGEVGVSISKENIELDVFNEYSSTFMFAESFNYDEGLLKVLSKGKYICLRFNGLHSESSKYYKKLLEYAKCNNYEILEDSIELTLVDTGLTSDKSKFVTEIQILVEKY